MAYLDNTTITMEAILTKKGRELLSSGRGLGISQYALADDEIDYTLYDPAHPLGSAYYDSSIRALPILEATPDETQLLRYKLVTLPKTTTRIPQIELGIGTISVNSTGGSTPFTPSTTGGGNARLGYTAILHNRNAGEIVGTGLSGTSLGSVPVFLGDAARATAQVVKGTSFEFIPNSQVSSDVSSKITVVGNETGGTVEIPVTVVKVTKV